LYSRIKKSCQFGIGVKFLPLTQMMYKPVKKFIMKFVLEDAIAFEEKAYRFYQKALSMTVVDESSHLLKRLLAAELGHRLKLEEIQKTGDPEDLIVSDPVIFQGVSKIDRDWPDLNPRSTKEEIFKAALIKERGAYDFYKTLAENSLFKTARDVFGMLSREESDHINWLQNEIGEESQ
ncbi:MAG: ferritin family protein, partial [Spirochaetes bacterium]|nr:ferritin family protein [Spirochaetota bacterium]